MFLQLTKIKQYKGGVAIIAVISLTFITLLAGVALSISSIDYKLSTIGQTYTIDLKHLNYSCQEEALNNISENENFVGNRSVLIDGNSCSYTVSINGQNSNLRDVVINVSKDDYSNSSQFQANISTNPITKVSN